MLCMSGGAAARRCCGEFWKPRGGGGAPAASVAWPSLTGVCDRALDKKVLSRQQVTTKTNLDARHAGEARAVLNASGLPSGRAYGAWRNHATRAGSTAAASAAAASRALSSPWRRRTRASAVTSV